VQSVWHKGLEKVIKKLQEVIKTVDKRTIWLKNNYVQQYIISDGRGPMTADAIRVRTLTSHVNLNFFLIMFYVYTIFFNEKYLLKIKIKSQTLQLPLYS